jgi:hypothetical protein
MANLLRDQLSSVKLSDVRDFLCLDRPQADRPAEGTQIDYKEDLPQDIGNDVAALSNTFGGLIFIGVTAPKEKQNIPVAIAGADLGEDATARITNRILSTVHPRPEFEVHSWPVGKGLHALALVRVREGTYPPYEFSHGSTVRIPLRVQDTTRQATLREIEALLAKRRSLAMPTRDIVEQYLGSQPLFHPLSQNQMLAGNFHRTVAIPRVPLRVRLDSKFERFFQALIKKTFSPTGDFSHHRRFGGLYQTEVLTDSSHKIWRVWGDGALGFASTAAGEPEPIGNLAGDILFLCRLSVVLWREKGYFGDLIFAHHLEAFHRNFSAKFPPPGGMGDYDEVGGIYFPTSTDPSQPITSLLIEEVALSSLEAPQELIATVLLDQLRHVCGARVDYDKLFEAIDRLANDPYVSSTW